MRLEPADLEALARRVAELLRGQAASADTRPATPARGAASEVTSALVGSIVERYGPCLNLTVQQAADVVRISDKKIYKLQDQGRFPVAFADSKRLVPLGELVEWVAAGGSRAARERPLGLVAAGGRRTKRPIWANRA